MPQYALPTSDVSKTDWVEGVGDGDGDAFDELDEGFGVGRGSGSGPDDAATYWETGSHTFTIRMQCESVTDPLDDTNHFMRTRNRKHTSGGQQIDIKIKLRKGTTDIAEATFVNVDNVWTTRLITLTEAEAANVDYADVRISTQHLEVGGGSPRQTQESTHEFECPSIIPPGLSPVVHQQEPHHVDVAPMRY